MPNKSNKKIFEGLVSKTKIYLVVIAILLILICVLNTKCILPSIIVYALILLYTYWSNKKRRSELSEHIQELTFHVDKVAKNTMINSPFPLVIAETDGNILWKSTKFTKEFANIDIANILKDLLKQIKLEIENNPENSEKNINKEQEIDNKIYIGRVAILKEYRKKGYATKVINFLYELLYSVKDNGLDTTITIYKK